MCGVAEAVTTSLADLQAASAHVKQVRDEVHSELNMLMGQMDTMTARWQGRARIAFQRVQVKWHEDSTRLNEALSHIADAIAVSKGAYQAHDEAAEQSMNTIANALG